MKKKIAATAVMLILLIACLALFASCSRTQVDLDEYMKNGENGVDNLNVIGKLVKAMHEWIGAYGWTVVLFTVFLKIIMLPLDFWQRFSMKKNALSMQSLQGYIEKIDKQYGANTQKANEEKQKLYKKHNVTGNMFASCLPMIISMVIFFVMFGGLNSYATYHSVVDYNDLRTFYYAELDKAKNDPEVYEVAYQAAIAEGKTTEAAEAAANDACVKIASEGDGAKYQGIGNYYVENVREGFLWIDNIWQPDTWSSIMKTYDEFSTTVKIGGAQPRTEYDLIRTQVLNTHHRGGNPGAWNGLMLLPVMSVALSFLSIFISQRLERKKGQKQVEDPQQAASNKMMMFLMPLMMAYFGFMYTGAFAIYMVCNYMLSIITTVAIKKPVDKAAEKSLAKAADKNGTPKATYKR